MKSIAIGILASALCAGPALAQDTLPEFLGIQLGAAFSMPECVSQYNVRSFEQPITPCWGDEVSLGAQQVPSGDFEIEFATDYRTSPAGVKSQRVIVVDGVMAGVTVFTRGLDSQDDLADALTAKFGAPTSAKLEAVQNRMGVTFERRVMRWKLPGVDVEFFGMSGRTDGGIITVYTPAGKAFEERQLAELKARRQGSF